MDKVRPYRKIIYYVVNDTDIPTGGVKVAYRHVDILNHNGYDAAVIHSVAPFRCSWFTNRTKIIYLDNPGLKLPDYFVLPEGYSRIGGVKNIRFTRNVYYSHVIDDVPTMVVSGITSSF